MDQTPPTFFRITVGLYALLTVFGAAVALLVVSESKSISSAGGWGYLMAAFVFAIAAFFVCLAGVVCTALSLWRGETHRRLSMGLVDDFDPSQARWAVGLQPVLGMWWGITVLVPLALAVQVLAYATHPVLRRILTTT